MKPTTNSKRAWLAACLGLTVGVALPMGVLAQSAALVHVTPLPVTVREGQTAAAHVRVEDAQDLYGLDIRLKFDPAVAEVVDADPEVEGVQILPGDLLKPDFVVRNVADNAAGTVWFALTQLNPSEPVTGSGVVFTVTFRGKQVGASTPLTITYQKLAQLTGDILAASVEDGELRVVGEGQAPPTPTEAPPQATAVVPAATGVPTAVPPTAVPTPMPAAGATTQPAPAPSATAVPPEPTATLAVPEPTATPLAVVKPTGTTAPPPTATSAQVAQATARGPLETQRPPAPTPAAPSSGGLATSSMVLAAFLVLAAGIAFAILRARRKR
jgi:hypothetical protein